MIPSTRIRIRQIVARTFTLIFISGFFFNPVGAITGPVMGVWFVGTQRIWRGFLWMVAFGILFGAAGIVRGAIHAGAGAAAYVGWSLLFLVLGILPLTLHRIASPRLTGFVSTLPFPVFAALRAISEGSFLKTSAAAAHVNYVPGYLKPLENTFGPAGPVFLTCWFAATLLWAWNQEFRTSRIGRGVSTFAITCCIAIAVALFEGRISAFPALPQSALAVPHWVLFASALIFALSAAFTALRIQPAQYRASTLRILRSPVTAQTLTLTGDKANCAFATPSGERFAFRDGIADLRRPEDLTGDNGKYNHLYEFIGGFYDDIQRVVCALQGYDGVAYVMSYMNLLEVKPGDSVLETSVGTGLNFKYLPKGISLTGVDLSPEMLVNCRTKMRRWGLEPDLFMGNAECLPFADGSFDVVFHTGGINFFNDRTKAIAEMIRVAKPGSKIMIADETEEHVQEMYERKPITGFFYKNRKEPVKPPLDLIPAVMLETRLELLKPMGKNRFYVLTFRKPAAASIPLDRVEKVATA